MKINDAPDKIERLPNGFTLKSILVDAKGRFHRIAGIDADGVDVQDMESGNPHPYTYETLARVFVVYDPLQDPEYGRLIKTSGWVQARDNREIFVIGQEVDADGVLLISQKDGRKEKVTHEEIVCNFEFVHDLNELPVPRYTIEKLQEDVIARLEDAGIIIEVFPS